MAITNTDSAELCLSFANTVRWHASDHMLETLHSYADLIAWAQNLRILLPQEAQGLISAAHAQPIAAANTLQRAIDLREAFYRVVVAHINAAQAQADDLACINRELSSALPHQQVGLSKRDFVWQWNTDPLLLERVLWPLARSIAELLTSPETLARVGQCADDRGCGWLFLDTSKNHSRRWCDINDCGNRAKQRRHYQRERQQRV
jgi:predicted RNA-binding Zn ribbon-like protein